MGFLDAVTDLVGLYVNPPGRAVAFSTDERVRPPAPSPGSVPFVLPVRSRDQTAAFRAFLQMMDRETPRVLDVHMLLDSRLSPVPAEVEQWLDRHPRFHLHPLPADRAGLTLMDRLIDGFSRRKDRPGASASAHRLKYRPSGPPTKEPRPSRDVRVDRDIGRDPRGVHPDRHTVRNFWDVLPPHPLPGRRPVRAGADGRRGRRRGLRLGRHVRPRFPRESEPFRPAVEPDRDVLSQGASMTGRPAGSDPRRDQRRDALRGKLHHDRPGFVEDREHLPTDEHQMAAEPLPPGSGRLRLVRQLPDQFVELLLGGGGWIPNGRSSPRRPGRVGRAIGDALERDPGGPAIGPTETGFP